MRRRARFSSSGVLIAAALAGWPWIARADDGGQVVVSRSGARFGIRALDASLEEITRKFGEATGVEIKLDPQLKNRKLTIELAPRPAESVIWSIARRADARSDVVYLFQKSSPADSGKKSPWIYATDTVSLPAPILKPLEEALMELVIPARVDEGLNKEVRVFSPKMPLYRVLDNLAGQVGAKWSAEVRIDWRPAREVEAGSYSRMMHHFSDLARFPSAERQEEIEADLAVALNSADSKDGLARMATDIRGLATLYNQIPGEHRETLAPKFTSIVRDYTAVIRRASGKERGRLAPLITAIQDAESRLASAR